VERALLPAAFDFDLDFDRDFDLDLDFDLDFDRDLDLDLDPDRADVDHPNVVIPTGAGAPATAERGICCSVGPRRTRRAGALPAGFDVLVCQIILPTVWYRIGDVTSQVRR
jgi:hypothetical protein